jgi:hypothetical protein
MVGAKDKVQKALSEVRTLVLGAQILLGFQYQALFLPRFEELPGYGKALETGVFGQPSAPGAYHDPADDAGTLPPPRRGRREHDAFRAGLARRSCSPPSCPSHSRSQATPTLCSKKRFRTRSSRSSARLRASAARSSSGSLYRSWRVAERVSQATRSRLTANR